MSIASELGITMTYERKGPSPWGNGFNKWRVTLKGPGGTGTFEYHTGSAHKNPDIDDVVHSLLMESVDSETYGEDWREFASDFGYDTEDDGGKECRRLLRLMEKNARKMERVLPNRDFADILNTLYADY